MPLPTKTETMSTLSSAEQRHIRTIETVGRVSYYGMGMVMYGAAHLAGHTAGTIVTDLIAVPGYILNSATVGPTDSVARQEAFLKPQDFLDKPRTQKECLIEGLKIGLIRQNFMLDVLRFYPKFALGLAIMARNAWDSLPKDSLESRFVSVAKSMNSRFSTKNFSQTSPDAETRIANLVSHRLLKQGRGSSSTGRETERHHYRTIINIEQPGRPFRAHVHNRHYNVDGA